MTTLTFVDTDIREVAKNILGGILKVNYTIDPAVHGSATLDTATPLPRSALLPTLSVLLNQNGATLVQRDGTYLVVPTAAAAAALPAAGAATAGSEMVPLRFASAPQLAKVLEPYAAEGGRIVVDPTRNALLVGGDGAVRSSLISLIRAFDIDLLTNQSYALFPVPSGDPSKAAAELQKVLATEGDGRLAGLVRVVPMERANAVLVISGQSRYIEDVRRLYNLLDKAQGVTARSWHAYYVQNGESADLERLLQRAFTPGRVSSQSEASSGSTAPGFETVSMSSSKNASSGNGTDASSGGTNGTSGSALGQSGSGAGQQQAATPDKARAASDSLSSGDQGEESSAGKTDSMRIIANRRSNALLIYATPDEYSVVEAMLAKVDVLPLQVMIEATIAEVTLNDNLQYGTQFFFKGKGLNGELSTISSSSNVPITSTGSATLGGTYPSFVFSKSFGAVTAALSALQAVTDVKVLSSPQILVLDNEVAQLMVGNQVPVITQSATSTLTSTSQVVNSVDYHSTGVILQVMPRVNSGGLVTLNISQEVSDVVSTTSSNIDSPTFEERKVKSRIVVQDGQTVGLAGLIRDTTSRENSGVPWLKDIPLLGALASSQDNSRTRTELLILLTPRVVHDQRDARALTDDLRAKLGHADAVPASQAALRPSGSSNPNADLSP
jgi:general secretion pathway protein D